MDCLNIIILYSLRQREIDIETLKDITKIFINIFLWKWHKTEIIESTCCICDIGLMINDIDMNLLSMFCLNTMSENIETHEFIKRETINETSS